MTIRSTRSPWLSTIRETDGFGALQRDHRTISVNLIVSKTSGSGPSQSLHRLWLCYFSAPATWQPTEAARGRDGEFWPSRPKAPIPLTNPPQLL